MNLEEAKAAWVDIEKRETALYFTFEQAKPQDGMTKLNHHVIFSLAVLIIVGIYAGGMLVLALGIPGWVVALGWASFVQTVLLGGLVLAGLFLLSIIVKPLMNQIDRRLNLELSRSQHIQILLELQNLPLSYQIITAQWIKDQRLLSRFDQRFLAQMAKQYYQLMDELHLLYCEIKNDNVLNSDLWSEEIRRQINRYEAHQKSMERLNAKEYLRYLEEKPGGLNKS